MADFGDFSFKTFVFGTNFFGEFKLLWGVAVVFEQIVAHSFVTHKGVAVQVEGFTRTLQVIKFALCFCPANLFTDVVLEVFAVISPGRRGLWISCW